MNQKLTLLYLLISLTGSAGAYELPSATGSVHMLFEADETQYWHAQDRLNLTGRVKITETEREGGLPDRIIRGEEFNLWNSSRVALSSGPVSVEEGGNAVFGENGKFDMAGGDAYMENVYGLYGTWRVHGRSLSIKEKNHIYRKAVITSCSEFPPHYTISVGKLSVKPLRRLTAYNSVFYVRNVPVFYSPLFFRSLNPDKRFVTYLKPGYDERNGIYAKTTTTTRFNRYSTGKFFLDYFSMKGYGIGAESDYNNPEKLKAGISAFRIKEKGMDSGRWGIAGGNWHMLNKGVSACSTCAAGSDYFWQSQFRLVSDPNFNNDFFRNNPFAVSPDMNASAAFVRQTPFTMSRLSFSRRDDKMPSFNKFKKASETYPRLDFQTSPFAVKKIPVLNTFTAFFDSTRFAGAGPFNKSAGARWSVTQTIPVVKKLSLVPVVYYDETANFSALSASGIKRDLCTGRYGTNTNLRYNSLLGSFDLGYLYSQRLAPNRFFVDRSAADYGVESSRIFFQNFIRPDRKIYGRVFTAYDLRKLRAVTMDAGERFEPVTAEAGYTPHPDLNVFARNEYDLKDGNRAFFLQADAGNPEKNHIGFGVGHYISAPTDYIINQTMSWRPKDRSWHIDAALRYIVLTDSAGKFRTLSFFAKGLTFYRDFHDFRTSWVFNLRPGVKEFAFKIDMKMNVPARKKTIDAESEKFWRSWRKEGEVRD